jgi:hypothetical protein
MPTDPSSFDPYHKWLGIAPKDQPPHHYRLLGIELFEADAEVIDSAANQRMVFLAAHAQGAHAARAADLVAQVASARACLLDPQSRASYDAQLRQRQIKPKPQVARAPSAAWRDSPAARPASMPVATAIEPSSDHAAPSFAPPAGSTASTARRAQIRRKASQRQFRVGLTGQILASLAGLAIGYWIVSSVDPRFDFLNLRGGGEVVERPQPSPPRTNNRPQEPLKPRPQSPRPIGDPLSPAAKGVPGQPEVAVETPTKASVEPAPVAAPVAKTDPFVHVPATVDLPPLEEGPPAPAVILAKTDLAPTADFDLLLKSFITGAKTSKAFRLERVDTHNQSGAASPRWHVLAHGGPAAGGAAGGAVGAEAGAAADATKSLESDSSMIPVAEIALAGDTLTFAWLPEAHTTYAEALRNCVLTLRAGSAEKSLALRHCEHIDAVHLDMEKSYVLTPLPAGTFSPPVESLRLELLQAEQLPPGATILPESKLVGGADEIRIVLRTDVPAVELRARLYTSGKNTSIRIAPVIADAAGKPLPFTLDRLNSLKQQANKEIANAEKVSATLSQRIKLIPAEIARWRGTVVTTFTAQNKVKAKIADLEAESLAAAAEVDRLTKVIPEMKSKLQLSDPLFTLINQLRNGNKLHFRVFYVCEEQEVDVLRAG